MKREKSSLPRDVMQHLAAHVELYQRDPDRAHLWDSSVIGIPGPVRTLLLRTTGRRSGEDRYVTLQYFTPGGKYVVVGSRGGTAEHPAWYLNLVDDPRCHVQVGTLFSSAARARLVEGEEYAALWTYVGNEQPQYEKYQARTSRRIPLVVLEPVDSDPDISPRPGPISPPRGGTAGS